MLESYITYLEGFDLVSDVVKSILRVLPCGKCHVPYLIAGKFGALWPGTLGTLENCLKSGIKWM
jgi:hypothetical protein